MRYLVYLSCSLLLAACDLSTIKDQFPGQSTEKTPTSGSQGETSLQALFAQSRIDPLTDYLNKYQNDGSKRAELTQVKEERDQRCDKIAQRYADRAATDANLTRLRSGYQYSCPDIVEAFAQRIQQDTEAAVKAETSQAETEAELEQEEATMASSSVQASSASASATAEIAAEPAEEPEIVVALATNKSYSLRDCKAPVQQGAYQRAISPCQQLAETGDPEAQYLLANLYEGGKGIARDEQQALIWYHKAAQQQHAAAQSSLGVYYYGIGDYTQAAEWQRKAANQNYPDAQYLLGIMYELGQGVPQDFVLAYQWFLLSAGNGAKGALEARRSLAAKLSSEQIAEGQKLARSWRAK